MNITLNIQDFMDKISEANECVRKEYHLTLGELLDHLEKLECKEEKLIPSLCNPHSYRGYYTDLAFALSDNPLSIDDTICLLKNCLGKTFDGYKGGSYTMNRDAPLWCAEYGDTGYAIIDITKNELYVKKLH